MESPDFHGKEGVESAPMAKACRARSHRSRMSLPIPARATDTFTLGCFVSVIFLST